MGSTGNGQWKRSVVSGKHFWRMARWEHEQVQADVGEIQRPATARIATPPPPTTAALVMHAARCAQEFCPFGVLSGARRTGYDDRNGRLGCPSPPPLKKKCPWWR